MILLILARLSASVKKPQPVLLAGWGALIDHFVANDRRAGTVILTRFAAGKKWQFDPSTESRFHCLVPMRAGGEMRPDIGAALAAGLANKQRLNV